MGNVIEFPDIGSKKAMYKKHIETLCSEEWFAQRSMVLIHDYNVFTEMSKYYPEEADFLLKNVTAAIRSYKYIMYKNDAGHIFHKYLYMFDM